MDVFIEEKVGFVADTNHPDRFLPRICVSKKWTSNGQRQEDSSFRAFEKDDMARVLDFEQVPDPPADGPVRYCEDAGTEGLRFPVRHVCLRGGYLFYFDVQDVDDEVGIFDTTYHAPPLGVVPLENVLIEFPPGGRRFFRDHAHHDDARNGYELVILHDADDPTAETTRPPIFLVLDSMGQREAFSKALQVRAEVRGDTLMRPSTVASRDTSVPGLSDEAKEVRTSRSRPTNLRSLLAAEAGTRSIALDNNDEEEDIDNAKQEFGVADFSVERWLDKFFSTNNDFDAPAKCRELEEWQASIKNGLKGAVKEQYVYFVDASREMTMMGKEVNTLKEKVEKQNELIKDMKEIDFSFKFGGEGYDSDEDQLEPGHIRRARGRRLRAQQVAVEGPQSDDSSLSSVEEPEVQRLRRRKQGKMAPSRSSSRVEIEPIEIPEWLEDVGEEISAFIKECRYTDAADLLFKAKAEVTDILGQHDIPIEDRLSKKQHASILEVSRVLEKLTDWMSSRLAEGLRRKNEALKQAGKRERSDPLSIMAPMVSPCCLNDDAVHLHLLVKLGKTQQAATAFAARRSLLLMESLHERPIAGTGNVDIVIYAAQLSQSFFSCLASAVEGFLDLFYVFGDPNNSVDHPKDEDSSSMLSGATKNVPPGALASIVLWCDSELSKFASAFGGTRILGNLALSPQPRAESKQARIVGFENEADASNRERLNAIDVAAQCVDQAFQYASENLDMIGLPLTPRLAEYIRSRLKGCEAEVARKLDVRWKHVTVDWEYETNLDDNDIPMDERRGF